MLYVEKGRNRGIGEREYAFRALRIWLWGVGWGGFSGMGWEVRVVGEIVEWYTLYSNARRGDGRHRCCGAVDGAYYLHYHYHYHYHRFLPSSYVAKRNRRRVRRRNSPTPPRQPRQPRTPSSQRRNIPRLPLAPQQPLPAHSS
jgi:hypothetical protein